MLQYEELRLKLEGLKPEIDDLANALRLEQCRRDLDGLEIKASEQGFWDNMESAQAVLQKISGLKETISRYEKLVADYHDALTLIELADEAGDESLLDECTGAVTGVSGELDEQRLSTLLNGEYDGKNAILTFHAGAGGTEAQDWAEMLYRMYTHWAERHGFEYKILDYLDGTRRD